MSRTVLVVDSAAARLACRHIGGDQFSALCASLREMERPPQAAIMEQAMFLKSRAEPQMIPNGSIRSVRDGLAQNRRKRHA